MPPTASSGIIRVPNVRPFWDDIVNILLDTESIVNVGEIEIVATAVTFKDAFVVNPLIAVPLRAFTIDDASVTLFPLIEAT